MVRWFYESFVPGEDCCELGLRRRYSLRSTFSLGGMHRAAKLDRTSQISDGFQRRPQTISSPPPQRKVVAGTKDPPGVSAPSAGLRPLIVSRVKCGGRTLSQPLSEVPYELSTDAHSKKCKRSPKQIHPAGFPPHDNFQPGTKDSAGPRHTGHGPFRARPPASNNKADE